MNIGMPTRSIPEGIKLLKYRKSLSIILFVLAFTASLHLSITEAIAQSYKTRQTLQERDEISYISFSADGKKLLFDRSKGKEKFLIHVYDLQTHELSAYQPPPDERWMMARYSHDGKHITFSISRRGQDGREIGGPIQIGIMDPDGKNVRELTNSIAANMYPTFSHLDDKVIYAKCARRKGTPPGTVGAYDIYEVDIKTGIEKRLTWFNIFSILSPPFEFPDGETIVFSAFGVPGLPHELDRDNSFLVKKAEKNRPDPFIILDGRNPQIIRTSGTRRPLVSKDGNLMLFQANARRPNSKYGDGDQFFQYSKSGIYRRLTYLPVSTVFSADLSPNGTTLAVVHVLFPNPRKSKKISICNIVDGTYRTIELPDQPSHIINNVKPKSKK